eukprot:284819596_2
MENWQKLSSKGTAFNISDTGSCCLSNSSCTVKTSLASLMAVKRCGTRAFRASPWGMPPLSSTWMRSWRKVIKRAPDYGVFPGKPPVTCLHRADESNRIALAPNGLLCFETAFIRIRAATDSAGPKKRPASREKPVFLRATWTRPDSMVLGTNESASIPIKSRFSKRNGFVPRSVPRFPNPHIHLMALATSHISHKWLLRTRLGVARLSRIFLNASISNAGLFRCAIAWQFGQSGTRSRTGSTMYLPLDKMHITRCTWMNA